MTGDCIPMGFDCRIWGARYVALWDASSRSSFLLDPNAACPLSVDDMVWPSVFERGGVESEAEHDVGINLPAFIGPHAPFWANLAELEAEISKHNIDVGVCKIVQVILCSRRVQAAIVQQMVHPSFRILGFDVADEMFVSSLTNCGYSAPEEMELRLKYGEHLNEHHLFDNLKTAVEYCTSSDNLVPEHAPFAPHLLAWRV